MSSKEQTPIVYLREQVEWWETMNPGHPHAIYLAAILDALEAGKKWRTIVNRLDEMETITPEEYDAREEALEELDAALRKVYGEDK